MQDLLLFAHIIGACVLLGTGAGIAFFMLISHRSQNPALIAHVAGIVVLADWIFTATAAVVQPITGALLAANAGWPLGSGWVLWSLILYVFVGVFWLPVVWIQKQLQRLAQEGEGLPCPRCCSSADIWAEGDMRDLAGRITKQSQQVRHRARIPLRKISRSRRGQGEESSF